MQSSQLITELFYNFTEYFMKAEIQFFAMPDDVETLLEQVKDKVDRIETNNSESCLLIGDCNVIVTAGTLQADRLIVGSVAINTGLADDACADQERAKAIYRQLRKWLKKNYSNKLKTRMLEGKDKVSAARNHWLSPAAKEWSLADSKHQMKLYDTSPIVFEVMVVSKQMGEIKPVSSNKVRGHG